MWLATETHAVLPLFTRSKPFGRLTRQLDSSAHSANFEMPARRNDQEIAIVLSFSLLIGRQSARAQTSKEKPPTPAKPAEAPQKPNYPLEAIVVVQVITTLRFERDGTGHR